MGILNVSPDSFFDGGKYSDPDSANRQIRKMLREGADIIDIGASSSRPGAKLISDKTEWKRLKKILEKVIPANPNAIFSIDTYNSTVAGNAFKTGVHIVNDISAGTIDKNMFKVVAKLEVPYILMHMKGTPAKMQSAPRYKNVTVDIIDFLRKKIDRLRKMGLTDIIVDPGFGFGKTNEHNYQLLRELSAFQMLDCPILAGISRKSMLWKVIGSSADKALNATTAANILALNNGADILRVHDVREAVEAVKVYNAYKG